MAPEGDVIQVAASEVPAASSMSVEDALKDVLHRAVLTDGVKRGLRESVKALERQSARLCIVAESCNEAAYTNLVAALCNAHGVNMIKIADGQQLGEWVGLCKYDKNGDAQKVVRCSCAVVTNFGEESEAHTILAEYFKSQ